jgi:hypothetical protein
MTANRVYYYKTWIFFDADKALEPLPAGHRVVAVLHDYGTRAHVLAEAPWHEDSAGTVETRVTLENRVTCRCPEQGKCSHG